MKRKTKKKEVLFVSSEALPFAASGGLGDVIGSLPAAINSLGENYNISVVLPLYERIKAGWGSRLELICEFTVPLAWRNQYCGIYMLKYDGVTFYFTDNEYYFKRNSMYGDYDDGERFAFFCRAVLDMLPRIGLLPDIIHCHDWQSALCVVYLRRQYSLDPRYSAMKSVFTIHNIEYQGKYGFEILGDVFALSDDDRDTVACDGLINLMKAAIVTADAVTTVSQTYSQEILTDEMSHGLGGVLRMRRDDLFGIINGIDCKYYDPMSADEMYMPFSADNFREGKAECKARLADELLLDRDGSPLAAVISRLTGHKGTDMIVSAADSIIASGAQLVILGTGDAGYEEFFAGLQDRHPGRVSTVLRFDKQLSKRIYAAADLFIMPSRSEPCGLAQMIASRYGAVPLVRLTGGLADTISEPDNGFTFVDCTSDELIRAVGRALQKYNEAERWNGLVQNVMNRDFSWSASARRYTELYKHLTEG